MRLISSYDDSWEQHELIMAKDHLRTVISEVKAAREHLANAVFGIGVLIDGAEELEELCRAEAELREALAKLERLKVQVKYAAGLMRGVEE